MKISTALVLAGVAVIGLGLYLGLGTKGRRTVYAQVRGDSYYDPYSLWRHHEGVGAPPNKNIEFDTFVGRRANGDIVMTSTEKKNSRRRLLSVQGVELLIDDALNTTTTFGTGKAGSLFGHENCEPEQPPPAEDVKYVLGFKVFRHMRSSPLMPTDEVWVAPDLGCKELERMTTFVKDGMDGSVAGDPDGYTKITATMASTDPPPDSMFHVPENAREINEGTYWELKGPEFKIARDHDKAIIADRDAAYAKQATMRQKAGITLDVFKAK